MNANVALSFKLMVTVAMNVERLTEIVTAIKKDIERTKLLKSLANIVSALDTMISQPPNPAHEDNLNNNIKNFNDAIDASSVSAFPTTWRPYLEEMGVNELLGEPLRMRVMGARNRNEITAKIFRDELQSIQSELSGYHNSFSQIIEGMSIFDFSSTTVNAGSAELSFLMPRAAFDNGLKAFSLEVKFFDDTTRFFSEIATGGREEPKLNQLSTTEPVVTIATTLGTALLFLKVVEKILDVMIKTQKLREAKKTLEQAEAGLATVRSIQKDINEQIESGLKDLKDWLFKEYNVSKDRDAELKTEAKNLLEKLAQRIDNGFKIDGDTQLNDEEEIEEDVDADPKQAKARELALELINVAKQIRHHEVPDGPVLQLPKTKKHGDDV